MASHTSHTIAEEVTRVALVIRLLSLTLVALAPQSVTPWAIGGQVTIAFVALWLLRSRDGRALVVRQPVVILADTALMTVVAVVSGGESPFILTFMTSALLLGVWTRPWVSAAHVATMAMLYGMVWQPAGAEGMIVFLVPFCFLILWWLGFAIQRSSLAEARSRHALRQAVSVAAANEERARLAREMHDTLAKSLQAINLTATALPVLVDRDLEATLDSSRSLQELSVRAIGDARALMSQLRRAPSGTSLGEMVHHLVEEWQDTTGIAVHLTVDGEDDVTDELVRYEVAMAVGEALENVRRHARADNTTVSVAMAHDTVEVTVADDGVGVSPDVLANAERHGHFGRRGMAERLEKVGGRMTWHSVPGVGTRVTLTAPRHGLIEVAGGI